MEKISERIELGCYTKMSEMKGISSAKEYIEAAIEAGAKAIGITDFESVQSFKSAEKYINDTEIQDFKILYGVQMQMKAENEGQVSDITIFVKEQKGLKNLYTMLSKSFTNSIEEYGIIGKNDLDKYRDGLLYGTCGSAGELYQAIENRKDNIDQIASYYDFIQVEPIYNAKKKIQNMNTCRVKIIDETKKMQDINKMMVKLGEKNNILVVATSNPLFVKKEDSMCNEILNHEKGISDCQYDNERFFHTTEEMLAEFSYIEKDIAYKIVVENTNKFANLCEGIKIEQKQFVRPKIENAKEIMQKKCNEKVKEIYGENIPQQVEERMKLELSSIIENQYEDIYILANMAVEKSKEMGYSVRTRGACGNSFVAFLLGITDYNPIDYDLPFEMFAGQDYIIEPDIDLNFSAEIQTQIQEYIAQKLGKDKVIYCGTISVVTEKSAREWIEQYEKDLGYNIGEDKKKRLANQLCGIKRRSGIHPGGIFVLPKDYDIQEFTAIENYQYGKRNIIRTHYEYHEVANIYKFDILNHDTPTMLQKLKELTKVEPVEADIKSKEMLQFFMNSQSENAEISLKGIPEFSTKFMEDMLKIAKPRSFNDFVCLYGMAHGTGTWDWNAKSLIKDKYIPIGNLISTRDDIMNYLVNQGIERKIAYEIATFIRKGRANRLENFENKWQEYKEIMKEHNIPEWYISSAEKVRYLFPKSHAIGYMLDAFKLAWYKIYYPKAFYDVYFEVKSDLDISKYTNKRQIMRKIKKLEYDEQDIRKEREIEDLKLLLEMYQRQVKEETKRPLDDYDLINSQTIGEYCREIRHKFNTEELAVLVYRNKKMDIKEKIEKYKELIENYPDMIVIERINCQYYSSVKEMIQKEIDRLNDLVEKLYKDEENVIYSYETYYMSTRRWDKSWDFFENIKTNFKDIDKEISEDIIENNDTLAYRVNKKYLNSDEPTIIAEYQVIEQKRILTNIKDVKNNFLDIDNIFIKIPTPFKKGDILVSWINTPYREGLRAENSDIFVLDHLCTWRENLDELLENGNYDSSDMIGYGYYMYDDSESFVCDHLWDYDSFEYYEGELGGIYRTLKGISSLFKEKITLEVFVNCYEEFKSEHRTSLADWYVEDALKLAGCTNDDIERYKENRSRKLYDMSEQERQDYLKYETYWFNQIDEKELKQVESNFYGDIFALMNNGDLYKNGEKIRININKIYMLDGFHLYQITKDNKIIPLQEVYKWNDWDETDKYLNYDNYSYQKIVTSPLHIVALTKEKDIRAVANVPDVIVIPENFKDAEDIMIQQIDGADIPCVLKNNQYIPLYLK